MTKVLTIRTDEALLERLDALAEERQRSRNFVANEALRAYLTSQRGSRREALRDAPVAERLEDYRSRLWLEDDLEDFEAFLRSERERSRVRLEPPSDG